MTLNNYIISDLLKITIIRCSCGLMLIKIGLSITSKIMLTQQSYTTINES